MNHPNQPHGLSAEELLAALRLCAGGTTEHAAIELLAAHGIWLRRAEFARHLDVDTDPEITGDAPAVATIDWDSAAGEIDRMPGTASELGVLRVALSLAAGLPVDLGSAVLGLDGSNALRVSNAILTAAGHSRARRRHRGGEL